jgi:putative heme-binding domain-containing protein
MVYARSDSASVTMQGLRLPAGFEVSEFADARLAHDIHCLTIDPSGRMVVSGRGYLRILVDDNNDGKADRAIDFTHAPRDGAHGLFWERDCLYCVGDGGLRIFREAGGKGLEKPSELLFPLKTGSEHLAHAVGRGPDGWLYLLVGDQTGISARHVTRSTSPIKTPIGGCVLRLSPDFKGCEIVADGFRNPYAMDWNADGELFTFDSDNERCVSLPWYEPTRCYHVQVGGHHGWLNPQHTATWRLPPDLLDVVPPVATLGRGSPTGVVCYRHTQFPARYRGGLFLLDWTFGQVHFVPLVRTGSSYTSKPEVFLHSVGDNGFAPVAAAVHPRTGDLYLAIGGRGTRGAVYRVRHVLGFTHLKHKEPISPRSRDLDWKADLAERLLTQAGSADLHLRRVALEFLTRHHDRFTTKQIEKVVIASAGNSDGGIRRATARLLTRLPIPEQERLGKRLVSPLERTTWYLARPTLQAIDLVKEPISTEVRLDGVRLVQRALGDCSASSAKGSVWEGYSRRAKGPTVPAAVREVLRGAFPSGQRILDRELTRTLALIEDDDPGLLQRVADRLTARSDPVDDIHFLIVLARLRASRAETVTRRVADALLALDGKLDARRRNRDRNWPMRIAELHQGLAARDPGLNRALLEHRDFGRPDHSLFCRCPGFDRAKAADLFLRRAEREEGFAWNTELIALVGSLPEARALPVLRKLWGEQGLDDAILRELVRHAHRDDHARFLSGLVSANLSTLSSALGAIEKLPRPKPGTDQERDEVFALASALRQLTTGKEEDRLRARLLGRLGELAETKLPSADAGLSWVRKQFPALVPRLADGDGVDVAGWQKRLVRINWNKGDLKRGQLIYLKASCASCHSGTAALGPDLRGVTGRFSRDDLFTAIVQPSKDVSPRYRTTQLTTVKGQVYQGIIVYEAVDSVLMLTGPGQSIRLAHTQIGDRKLTTTSLMPAGLLDRLNDAEISDLYAYLKSLTESVPRP